MELLLMRELASQMTASSKPGKVVASLLNPGFVNTSIMRNNSSRVFGAIFPIYRKMTARTPEEGARTLVWAAYGGPETHGKYLDDCVVGKVSPYIVSEKGAATQKKLWAELSLKLDKIEPGVMATI
jgi:retinol dehydrogenase 12